VRKHYNLFGIVSKTGTASLTNILVCPIIYRISCAHERELCMRACNARITNHMRGVTGQVDALTKWK
jgi:hypothetical protein